MVSEMEEFLGNMGNMMVVTIIDVKVPAQEVAFAIPAIEINVELMIKESKAFGNGTDYLTSDFYFIFWQ